MLQDKVHGNTVFLCLAVSPVGQNMGQDLFVTPRFPRRVCNSVARQRRLRQLVGYRTIMVVIDNYLVMLWGGAGGGGSFFLGGGCQKP